MSSWLNTFILEENSLIQNLLDTWHENVDSDLKLTHDSISHRINSILALLRHPFTGEKISEEAFCRTIHPQSPPGIFSSNMNTESPLRAERENLENKVDPPSVLDLTGEPIRETKFPKTKNFRRQNNPPRFYLLPAPILSKKNTMNRMTETEKTEISPYKESPTSKGDVLNFPFSGNASGGQSKLPIEISDRQNQETSKTSNYELLVEFKRKRIVQCPSKEHISPGDHAIVRGDRGKDIGLVVRVCKDFSPEEHPMHRVETGLCIVRKATPLEVSQFHGIQAELELRAVVIARQKRLEHDLPMTIVDAEYQFDRKKLTFFYEARKRLDFRDLVRDLYKTFRTRIWLEKVEDNSNFEECTPSKF